LLQTFARRADLGELVTAGQIQQAFEAEVGHPVHKSMVYRLLARHGWRKLVPRPRHRQPPMRRSKRPFSTISLLSCRRSSQPVTLLISDPCC
jgi:hypothetical protein